MSAKKPINRGPIYVLITGLLFSIGGLCLKIVPWNGLAINSFRTLLASGVIYIYLRITKHKLRLNKPVAIGAAALCVTSSVYAQAVKLTTAGAAIVIEFTVPIWTMLFGVLFFHKKPRRGDILACAAVFLGIAICFYEGLAEGRTAGNLLALLAGITYSGVFMSRQAENADPFSSSFFGNLASGIVGLPFLLRADFSALTLPSWISLLILGVVQMGLAYIFLSIGLETTPPVVACLLTGLEPVLNPIWVALFYGEPITPLFALGALIVLVSITVYELWNIKSEEKERSAP